MYDIIPDIHGHADKLEAALAALGYQHRHGAWRHSDPARQCLFLGDFIDRGPENAAVIKIVRDMIEAGSAQAIMGNHELNAIHFHTQNPVGGAALRLWTAKNLRQHKSFLAEFTPNTPATADVVNWMRSLPLYLEFPHFRMVHACWDEARIAQLDTLTKRGVLSEAQLIQAANPTDPLNDLVEAIAKGPETTLPEGYSMTDKDGTIRREVRVKWWQAGGQSWADVAMSVPDLSELPKGTPPEDVRALAYPAHAKPVFFGHYWMVGAPTLQAPNALCLDYSAGKGGPLVTYTFEDGAPLSLGRITAH